MPEPTTSPADWWRYLTTPSSAPAVGSTPVAVAMSLKARAPVRAQLVHGWPRLDNPASAATGCLKCGVWGEQDQGGGEDPVMGKKGMPGKLFCWQTEGVCPPSSRSAWQGLLSSCNMASCHGMHAQALAHECMHMHVHVHMACTCTRTSMRMHMHQKEWVHLLVILFGVVRRLAIDLNYCVEQQYNVRFSQHGVVQLLIASGCSCENVADYLELCFKATLPSASRLIDLHRAREARQRRGGVRGAARALQDIPALFEELGSPRQALARGAGAGQAAQAYAAEHRVLCDAARHRYPLPDQQQRQRQPDGRGNQQHRGLHHGATCPETPLPVFLAPREPQCLVVEREQESPGGGTRLTPSTK
eukprot:363759-Chlamydomonas_euryale.AAC.28